MKDMINTAWFEKYRPENFDNYVFINETQKNIVNKWIDEGKIDGHIIMYGPAGTGKSALAKLLIKQFIKSSSDLYQIRSRSVSAIDELYKYIIKVPMKSPHKIVYIEEFDRLSPSAMNQLKDGPLEDYANHTIFIACTNHINKINKELLTRFTYKFDFGSYESIDNITKRLKFILDSEHAIYKEEELNSFVEKNYQKGFRDIINSLQISFNANNKNIKFEDMEKDLNLEEGIGQLMLEIISIMLTTKNIVERKKCIITPSTSIVGEKYIAFTNILNNDNNIDYEIIYNYIIENINYIPCKKVFSDYYETYEYKKLNSIHLISCLYEAMKTINEIL